MSYRVEVWCSDCTDADPDGCFDGGIAHLVNTPDGYDIESGARTPALFATPEQAEEAFESLDPAGPWEMTIIRASQNKSPA